MNKIKFTIPVFPWKCWWKPTEILSQNPVLIRRRANHSTVIFFWWWEPYEERDNNIKTELGQTLRGCVLGPRTSCILQAQNSFVNQSVREPPKEPTTSQSLEAYLDGSTINTGSIQLRSKRTPWNWALLEKPPVAQLFTNFPKLYGTRWFITVFTRILQWFLSWARSIQ
jgi:hypothetical protein